MLVRIAYRFGESQTKIVSQYREKAKWTYNGADFEAKRETPDQIEEQSRGTKNGANLTDWRNSRKNSCSSLNVSRNTNELNFR